MISRATSFVSSKHKVTWYVARLISFSFVGLHLQSLITLVSLVKCIFKYYSPLSFPFSIVLTISLFQRRNNLVHSNVSSCMYSLHNGRCDVTTRHYPRYLTKRVVGFRNNYIRLTFGRLYGSFIVLQNRLHRGMNGYRTP